MENNLSPHGSNIGHGFNDIQSQSTVSFSGTIDRTHNREEAMEKLNTIPKTDRNNVPLDVRN